MTEHLQAKDLWATLRDNTTFIGYTTNENWGLWNFNVYLNQRHLAFGLLIVSLVIWLFMDWLDIGCAEEEKGIVWLRNRFFTKKAWRCICPENALMAGMFLGLTSFWNGAAVIGGLLILLGFAVFSDGKLDYLILAATSVIFSALQTRIFIWGEAVSLLFTGDFFPMINPVGSTVVPDPDEWDFLCRRSCAGVLVEKTTAESGSYKFPVSGCICIFCIAHSRYCSES